MTVQQTAGAFADRLCQAVEARRSPVVVGLDPVPGRLPRRLVDAVRREEGQSLKAAALCILRFNQLIIDAVADVVPIVKPQIAFFEAYGPWGMEAYAETLRYAASRGLLTLADAKRGDIGSTAAAYAAAFFGPVDALGSPAAAPYPSDALTVNPYFGSEGLAPFITAAARAGAGLFVLVKTSNASAGELQDRQLAGAGSVADRVAELVRDLGRDHVGRRGYSLVGAVVGATYPQDLARLRRAMPEAIILIPGYGAQGGTAADVTAGFAAGGLGALVNASRSILYAYTESYGPDATLQQVADAARAAACAMNSDLAQALQRAGLL